MVGKYEQEQRVMPAEAGFYHTEWYGSYPRRIL